MANIDTVRHGLAEINEAYPDRLKLTSKTLEIWRRSFAHIPDEVFTAGVEQAITQCQFPPTISDVFHAIKGMISLSIPNGLEAWGILKEALSKRSSSSYSECYKAIAGTPLEHVLDLLGGFDIVSQANEEYMLKTFISLYEKQVDTILNRQTQPMKQMSIIGDYAKQICSEVKLLEGGK